MRLSPTATPRGTGPAMSEHEPYCYLADPGAGVCICRRMAKARTDEREKVAQAIENRATTHECGRAYRHAARIARNGGDDA